MEQLICLKKLNSIFLESNLKSNNNKGLVVGLNQELISMGFILNKETFTFLQGQDEKTLTKVYKDVVGALKKIKGDDVEYRPMYLNFPEEVRNYDKTELYFNNYMHYWSHGTLYPESNKEVRTKRKDNLKLKPLSLANKKDLNTVFDRLVTSQDSISEEDYSFIKFLLLEYEFSLDKEIKFNEIKCFLATLLLSEGKDFSSLVDTSTDILRIATSLSGGDISLATNTKFKSLKRSVRRKLLNLLEEVVSEEDIKRHEKKWNKLFHNLHVGEYKLPKTNKLAKKVRDNITLQGFNSKAEKYLLEEDVESLVSLLIKRPGDFARRLSHCLSICRDEMEEGLVYSYFETCVSEIPTKILLQVENMISLRKEALKTRIVFPKGNTQKAVKVSKELKPLDKNVIEALSNLIKEELVKRFSKEASLGKVYLDKKLKNCPLPTQQRSSSEGAFGLARGTRIPLELKTNTLRFFIYWKGRDIDLSATFHNEKFEYMNHVSYTNLKSEDYESYHSGDITSAPNGASEFIDLNIDQALKMGARYVVMNVFVYSGPKFNEHEICYAGWMEREYPNSNEIYDPKTVKQRVSLESSAKEGLPVVFDLKTREAVWVDVAGRADHNIGGNNVESNRASISETLESLVTMKKPNLYDLFELHAKARGEVVSKKSEAEKVFSLDSGTTPYDILEINSEYLK